MCTIKESTRNKVLLILIILLGFFLRIYKVNHHLQGELLFKYQYHYLNVIIEGLKDNPPLNHPPLFTIFVTAINKIYYLFYFLQGHFHQFTDLIAAFRISNSQDTMRLLLVHRLVNVFFGTLTILVLYLIGRKLFDSFTGLISALLLAICPVHIVCSFSHHSSDILQLFFISIAFLYICKVFKDAPQMKYYIICGIFIGLAASMKYLGFLCLPILILAHAFNKRTEVLNKHLYLGVGIALLIFLIQYIPALIINFDDFILTFRYFLIHFGLVNLDNQSIFNVLSRRIGWISYPASLMYGLGMGIFFLSILGLTKSIIRHNKQDILILIFPLAYYLFMGNFYNCYIRYLLPFLPFMILFASDFLLSFNRRLIKKLEIKYLFPFLFACFLLPSLSDSIYFERWISQKVNIGRKAKEWVIENIPKGSDVLFDTDGRGDLNPILFNDSKTPYNGTIINWQENLDENVFFAKNNFDYVIISSSRPVLSKFKPFYNYIDKNFILIKEFKPLFPAPHRNFFSIYGDFYNLYYNGSFKIYKKKSHNLSS